MKSSELLRMSSTTKEQSKLETTEKIENQVMSECHDEKLMDDDDDEKLMEILCFPDDDEEWELQAAIVAQKIENEYFGSKTTDNDM